jgi:replicative DNA helicase
MSAVFDPELSALKLPPHSVEAEQSVLGGLMLENTAWERVADLINEQDFYRADHKAIWKQIVRLIDDNKPADVVTVAEALESLDQLDNAGGLAYLAALAQNTPSAANIRRYAEIVRERSVLRKLVEVGAQISDSALSPAGRTAAQILDEAEARVFEIKEAGAKTTQGFQAVQPLLMEVVTRIDELYNRDNPSEVTGVPTGFTDLDTKTSGLQPGDLIIVAGRPSMGKAQPLDAKVRTRIGWRPMGDLKIGDELASLDGRPSIVQGIYPQGRRQIYRVRFSDGRSAECCAEHLWRVHYRDWPAPRVLRTDQVMTMLTRVRYRDRLWIDPHNGELNIAENVALDTGLPVAVFSMEMGAAQLVMRLIGSVGRLDQHRLRTGRLLDEDWQRLTAAVGRLNDAPMHIDETPALNSLEVRARARRLHRQYGKLGLIVLDYLQLMSSTSQGENRATEISEISRGLKALAKELNVPVVALSQLNRSLEQRPNKRPIMSDLRESGAIEQDADVILFIYRDEVYNPDSPDKGTAEIIIGKQRNGPIGTVKLTFRGENTRFETRLVRKGEGVGYGAAFVADRDMKVGVVACGYADGYPRHAGTGTPVVVQGQRTRTLGRVSMDMLFADLSNVPTAHVGSPVTLWGADPPAEQVAAAAGTIAYELFTALAPRVPVEET